MYAIALRCTLFGERSKITSLCFMKKVQIMKAESDTGSSPFQKNQ